MCIKKRKKFLLKKSILKKLNKKAKKEKISKNLFLNMSLEKAIEQYKRENLFFYSHL